LIVELGTLIAELLEKKTMSGIGIQRQGRIPQSQQQRFGETLVLDVVYYDTLLDGVGETLLADNILFNRQQFNENRCNLKKPGEFSDGKQFAMYMLGCHVVSLTNPLFPDIFVNFSRLVVKYQDAEKCIVWVDQAGAGGGVAGYDQNAGNFHLTNGTPSSGNMFRFVEPLVIVPGKTFQIIHKFTSGRVGGAVDPLTYTNVTDAANDRTVRFYVRGLEGRDPENG
jgi:hypothetical protein